MKNEKDRDQKVSAAQRIKMLIGRDLIGIQIEFLQKDHNHCIFQRIQNNSGCTLNNHKLQKSNSTDTILKTQMNMYLKRSLHCRNSSKEIIGKFMFKSKENKEIDALDALEIKRNGDILFEESEYYTGGEGSTPVNLGIHVQSTPQIKFFEKISVMNERESSILKGIFFKNFADISEKTQTKRNILNGANDSKFAEYFKKLKKEKNFHTDWIINSKTNSKNGSPTLKVANNSRNIIINDNKSVASNQNYASILNDKNKNKEKKYGSKIMNAIFKKY